MKARPCTLLVILACLSMCTANACTLATDAIQTYFVSAVMTKNGVDATIKLMHSVVRERSENEALQVFVRAAIKQYPDYKMSTVLASKESSISCMKSGDILAV